MLLAHGHRDAYRYHLGRVWFEAGLVASRLKRQAALDMIAMQAVLIGSFGGKPGIKAFSQTLKEFGDG